MFMRKYFIKFKLICPHSSFGQKDFGIRPGRARAGERALGIIGACFQGRLKEFESIRQDKGQERKKCQNYWEG